MTEKLLAFLESRANHRGRVITAERALLEHLNITRDALGAGLSALERAGTIEILTPLPFLVVKLPSWPSRPGAPAKSATPAYGYPKQLLHTQEMKDSYRAEVAVTSNGLLQEILEVLGEEDPAGFQKAVELYAPHVIRTALDRVRRARTIRKSRTALFRHLLPRIAKESHAAP